eukprot:PhM_4_TR7910/c0_g1_i1/m.102237
MCDINSLSDAGHRASSWNTEQYTSDVARVGCISHDCSRRRGTRESASSERLSRHRDRRYDMVSSTSTWTSPWMAASQSKLSTTSSAAWAMGGGSTTCAAKRLRNTMAARYMGGRGPVTTRSTMRARVLRTHSMVSGDKASACSSARWNSRHDAVMTMCGSSGAMFGTTDVDSVTSVEERAPEKLEMMSWERVSRRCVSAMMPTSSRTGLLTSSSREPTLARTVFMLRADTTRRISRARPRISVDSPSSCISMSTRKAFTSEIQLDTVGCGSVTYPSSSTTRFSIWGFTRPRTATASFLLPERSACSSSSRRYVSTSTETSSPSEV